MRGEYWTRCFRVRSEMLASEDVSARMVNACQRYGGLPARHFRTWGRTIEAKVSGVDDGDSRMFSGKHIEGRKVA